MFIGSSSESFRHGLDYLLRKKDCTSGAPVSASEQDLLGLGDCTLVKKRTRTSGALVVAVENGLLD